jgi:hypothetical protein
LRDLERRLEDGVAEVVFDGAATKAGIGPQLRKIRPVGDIVRRRGNAFMVRPSRPMGVYEGTTEGKWHRESAVVAVGPKAVPPPEHNRWSVVVSTWNARSETLLLAPLLGSTRTPLPRFLPEQGVEFSPTEDLQNKIEVVTKNYGVTPEVS